MRPVNSHFGRIENIHTLRRHAPVNTPAQPPQPWDGGQGPSTLDIVVYQLRNGLADMGHGGRLGQVGIETALQ